MTELQLDDDQDLPTRTEGEDLSNEDQSGTTESVDIPVGQTDYVQSDVLPGAPKNEFEALKESLLGSENQTKIDEVTVNEDVINDEDVNDGSLFHEHTNYDTAVLNHPGGPYLTDVENARNAVIAERRMAANQDNPDEDRVAELDGEFAEQEADATVLSQMRNESNANIAEREDRLRRTSESNVVEDLKTNSQEGGLVPNPPQSSPSGVNPPPAPSETVPGESPQEDVSDTSTSPGDTTVSNTE